MTRFLRLHTSPKNRAPRNDEMCLSLQSPIYPDLTISDPFQLRLHLVPYTLTLYALRLKVLSSLRDSGPFNRGNPLKKLRAFTHWSSVQGDRLLRHYER